MVRTFIVITFLFLLTGLTSGQEESVSPSRCEKPVFFTKTAALRDMPVIPPEALLSAGGHDEVENTDRPGQTPAVCFTDPLWQSFDGFRSPGTFVSNFEGVGNLQYKIPPDTEGDVGPQHYLQMINMSFAVFDKEGNILYGPAANVTIWQGMPAPWSSVSNGDPIVLYDEAADRWLVSELSFPTHPLGPYYIKIAVSATGDPTGSWYLYGYEYDYFCDYPKFGVWHDGYYLTTNNNYWENNAWHFHAVGVSVFQRDSMLTGSPDAQRIFFDFYPNQVPWSVLPADSDGDPPPAGLPAYLAYLDEGNPDRITMYQVITDWVIPSHSSLQWMVTLLPEPFSGSLPAGIEQPENAPYLAPLSNRIMYRLQFRQFDGYHAMVTNHTVNRGDAVAAVRWYEFRDAGSGWVIHQQGTYSPDDRYRWMGSIAMDGYGNIALGYSVSSKEVYPSIRYTGRKAGDPPGVMTLAEEVIMEGYGVQLNPNHRWGDYSSMSVDPTDQCTFWYTQQYYEMTGDRSWQTRIAAFHIQDYPGLQVAAEPDSLCLGEEVQLYAIPAGGSGNYSYSWYSDPPGFYSSQQDPVDVPGTTTVYFCEVDDGVNQLSDQVTVFVQPPPEAYAGQDTTIQAGDSYHIQDSYASNHSGVYWSTSGDGTFSDSTLLHPVYEPGPEDIATGLALLQLTALPVTLCEPGTDDLHLFIETVSGTAGPVAGSPLIHIWPNPARGKIYIGLSGHDIPLAVTVRLTGLDGTHINSGTYDLLPGATICLELLRQNPGVFLLEIRWGEHRMTEKVLLW